MRDSDLQCPKIQSMWTASVTEDITHCSIPEFIHYNGDAIPMSFGQNSPDLGLSCKANLGGSTYLSNVDFPAPKKPQMMVRGTRLGSVGCSMSVLGDSEFIDPLTAVQTYGISSSDMICTVSESY